MLKKFFARSKKVVPQETLALEPVVDLKAQYRSDLKLKGFVADSYQLAVLEYLQDLLAVIRLRQSDLNLVQARHAVKHLYIYGGVGHGKSMLMDIFFQACPIEKKRRVHFHAFMKEVHEFFHQLEPSQRHNKVERLVNEISRSVEVLCFDELHITDIADAMIIERLFRCLSAKEIIIIMTSNRQPPDLYKGGVLRDQLLGFVDFLQTHSEIVELKGDIDYRTLNNEKAEQRYYFPLNNSSEDFILHSFLAHSRADKLTPGSIQVYGRTVKFNAVHKDVLLTSFAQLCQKNLAAADYLKIAESFKIVVMSGVPVLTPERSHHAKRFETLIDALYEHKVLFICSAEAPPTTLYLHGEGSFEFQRTVSRLMEMQADTYPGS